MFNLARNHDSNQFSRDDLVKRADYICNRLRKNQIRDQLSHRVNISIDPEDSLTARSTENESMKTGCRRSSINRSPNVSRNSFDEFDHGPTIS